MQNMFTRIMCNLHQCEKYDNSLCSGDLFSNPFHARI